MGNLIWVAFLILLTSGGKFDPLALVWNLAGFSCVLFLLTRFGFLSVVAFSGVGGTLTSQALTLRPSDWYFASGMISLLVIGLLVGWGYRAAVGGPTAVR